MEEVHHIDSGDAQVGIAPPTTTGYKEHSDNGQGIAASSTLISNKESEGNHDDGAKIDSSDHVVEITPIEHSDNRQAIDATDTITLNKETEGNHDDGATIDSGEQVVGIVLTSTGDIEHSENKQTIEVTDTITLNKETEGNHDDDAKIDSGGHVVGIVLTSTGDMEHSEKRQTIDATHTITSNTETEGTHDGHTEIEVISTEDKKCTTVHDSDNKINSNNDQSKEHGETTHSEVKPIPYQWWRFGLLNMLQLKLQGHNFLMAGTETNGSTVYKLKFDEYRIMVCDHLGMEALLDLDNFKRDHSFGFAKLNPVMLKQHIPCVLSSDEEHRKKKEFLLNFLKDATQHLTISNMVQAIQAQFEKMEPVHFEDGSKAEEFDFESVIKEAVANVMTYFLLGEYVEDSKLIYNWQDETIKLPFSKHLPESEEIKITNELFEKIESTKNVKELKNKVDTSGLDYEEMVSQIVWATCFNGIGGTKSMVMSCLLCFLRLPESDKQLLKEDAEKLFSSSNYQDTLAILPNINAFYMEVLRLHPPVPSIFRRAKTDFVLQSISGNFQIKENDLLCGNAYMIQRDPNVFENPDHLMLTRPVEELERCNFAFGGYFLGESAPDNQKCPGDCVSNNILKVFIAFITRCAITPTKTPIYTGRNYGRIEGSDEPLRVLHFSYDN